MRTQRCYQWWEFAIRAAAIVLVTVWYGALFLLRRLCGAPATLSYDVFPVWARAVLRAAGVRVHIYGAERLDPKANYIFVANHASLFDIPVLLVASPVPVRILYKRQLERVPFLGGLCALQHLLPSSVNARKQRAKHSSRRLHR